MISVRYFVVSEKNDDGSWLMLISVSKRLSNFVNKTSKMYFSICLVFDGS